MKMEAGGETEVKTKPSHKYALVSKLVSALIIIAISSVGIITRGLEKQIIEHQLANTTLIENS